ncbi:MAG: DEDD exonuclease domain-containing protein [Candidatus Kapaibacterium sp.]
MLIKDATFIVTDVETTGRSATVNRITEVASVWVADGEILEERSTLVNPEQYIPQQIQEMTGITNAMVLAAPKGEAVFPEIRRWFTADSLFTAHNATFDFNFLQQSFHRVGVRGLSPDTLCTLRLARRLLPAKKGFSLGKLAAYLGIRIRNRHRALGDAYATAKVLLTLLDIAEDEYGCESIDDLLRLQFRPTTAFRKGKFLKEGGVESESQQAKPTDLPSTPGIYRMIGTKDQILYVGKAKNLRDRVGSYFRPGADHTPKIREMVKRVKRVEVEETGSELAAILRESRLIKELQPKYNTAGKRIRRYGFLRLDLTDPFPRISYVPEVSPDGAEYYGPFRNRDAAEMLVEVIDHLFQLRECPNPLIPHSDVVPCFYHQIHRCGAPCAMLQSGEEYSAEVDRVRAALSGSEEGIIGLLEEKMLQHSERLEFEEALLLRNRITELQRVFVWKRKFAESINTNNLIIILPATPPERNELFLIRYGRLARQYAIGSRFPEATLRGYISRIYFNSRVEHPQFDRIEVEEVRLIAGYLRRRSERGGIVHINKGDTVESVLERVRKELGEVRVQEYSTISNEF